MSQQSGGVSVYMRLALADLCPWPRCLLGFLRETAASRRWNQQCSWASCASLVSVGDCVSEGWCHYPGLVSFLPRVNSVSLSGFIVSLSRVGIIHSSGLAGVIIRVWCHYSSLVSLSRFGVIISRYESFLPQVLVSLSRFGVFIQVWCHYPGMSHSFLRFGVIIQVWCLYPGLVAAMIPRVWCHSFVLSTEVGVFCILMIEIHRQRRVFSVLFWRIGSKWLLLPEGGGWAGATWRVGFYVWRVSEFWKIYLDKTH